MRTENEKEIIAVDRGGDSGSCLWELDVKTNRLKALGLCGTVARYLAWPDERQLEVPRAKCEPKREP